MGNYDASKESNLVSATHSAYYDIHGTSVAGIIGASNNDIGGVGVAYDVSLTSMNLIVGGGSLYYNQFMALLEEGAKFDIANNSWGYKLVYEDFGNLADAYSVMSDMEASYAAVVAEGRGGLGTIIVSAAGNGVGVYDNYQGSAQANGYGQMFENITVAATNGDGDVRSYSSFGTNVLISAPSAWVPTDRLGYSGYSAGDYTSDFGGTSAATPVISGVAALMLEANPDLGWRDVQNILAASAQQTGSTFGNGAESFEQGAWFSNGANTWNGGGMSFNISYGYGMVDALAAVRMAEVWSHFYPEAYTSENLVSTSASRTLLATVEAGNSRSAHITITEDISIEHLQIDIDYSSYRASDATLILIDPDGNEWILRDRDGPSTEGWDGSWAYTVSGLRGVSSVGTWSVRYENHGVWTDGTFDSVSLRFSGAAQTVDDVHHITQDFLELKSEEPEERALITDSNGGADWLNLVALTGDVTVELGGRLAVNGTDWAGISGDIEKLALGDGNDDAMGNGSDNEILGGRGDDRIDALDGDDVIEGGEGSDYLIGSGGNDMLYGGDGFDYLFGGDGNDTLSGEGASGHLYGGRGDDKLFGGNESDKLLGEGANDLINGYGGNDHLDGGDGEDVIYGGTGNDRIYAGAQSDTVSGEADNDTIYGQGGDDILRGGDGVDIIYGGVGSDNIYGDAGRDFLRGEDDDDVIDGGTGADVIWGGRGRDTLSGGLDGDTIRGEGAEDIIWGDAGDDWLHGGGSDDFVNGGEDNDRIYGAAGEDDLRGSGGNDILFGGTEDDRLDGGIGEDYLYGNADNDTLLGNNGHDYLFGENGLDVLDGGLGNDHLNGGTQKDVLTGGGGADVFIFEDGTGVDTITDFEISVDHVDIQGISGITSAEDLFANHLYDTAQGAVFDSLNGDKIILSGLSVSDLSASDFLL